MSRSRFEKNKSDIRKIDNGGAAGKRTKRRRRASVGRLALVMTVLAAAAVGTVLSLTVFFKIKTIDVYGENRYSSGEIIKVGNIALESNLIRLDSAKIAQRIETKLPYIEEAVVKKSLPTTVEIHITAARVAGYVETKDGYSIVSTQGKVLEKTKKVPPKMAKITGIDVEGLNVAGRISDDQGALASIKTIFDALGVGMSSNITELSVGDRINLTFVYRDRVTVILGSEADLAEKLKFVSKIINDPEKIDEDDIGTIYASNAKRISFLRKGSYKELQEQLKEELEKQKQENNQNTSSGLENESLQGSGDGEQPTQNTSSQNSLTDLGTSLQN